MMWIPILVSFLLFGSIAANDYPSCQPIKAEIAYKDALFVFVLDFESENNDLVNKKRYVFKQLACEIPIAENLRTYVLDYGTDKPEDKKNVDEDLFLRSDETYEELINALELNHDKPNAAKLCQAYKDQILKFKKHSMVANHKNIIYIMFFKPTDICSNLNEFLDEKKNNIHIIFYQLDGASKPFTLLDRLGIEQIDPDVAKSTEKLQQIAKRITSKILGPPEPESKKTNEDKSGSETLILIVVNVVLLIVFIASIIFVCSKKRKFNKNGGKGKNEQIDTSPVSSS